MRSPILRSMVVVCCFCVAMSLCAAAAQQSSEQKAQPASAETKAQPAAPAAEARPADARQPTTPADPTGSWKWDVTTPDDNKMEFTLKLKWDGKKLDGNYTAFENTTKVEEGKIDKDTIAFVVRPEFGGNQFDVKFNGKVAKDEIRGTIGLNFGDQPQEIPWTAKRFVEADDVVGVWEMKMAGFDGNEFTSTLTITKDEKGLHGKTASDFGEFEARKVEIKDNQLIYELGSDQGEFTFKAVYRGTPRGNAIEGTSQFDFGGNTGEMKFTGKRLPPKEEKKAEPARPASEARPVADKQESKEPAAATKNDGK